MANRVDCIRKSDRHNPWERITHLAGTRDDNGLRWRVTQEECIAHIEDGVVFYMAVNAFQRVRLIVAWSAQGNKYVKTESDGEQPNNLLSLPECP
jgi:hypothetical protein